ncbi:MAG: MlaD family protein [Cyanobacteria bacterium P01_A01_bin.84]
MQDRPRNRFLSTRSFREGSVGLLVLLGLGIFGLIILWLNRLTTAGNSYKAIVEFKDAGGMQKGAVVRYRGVRVGNIAEVRPGANNVEVIINIKKPDLIIPKDSSVEANQSGLISESVIDITPKSLLPKNAIVGKPLDKNCNRQLIVCDGSRLRGEIGISVDELIRSTSKLANLYTQPNIYSNVNEALQNTSKAASQLALLTTDLSKLIRSTKSELNNFSSAASSVANAADKISTSSSKTIDKFGVTANQLTSVTKDFSATAKDVSLTTKQVNRLLGNLDNLVTSNRSSLVTALNDITQTSRKLRVTVDSLSPAVSNLNTGELVQNLETLSQNAAQASTNLKDVTKTLSSPNNILVLQQTLDSARVTFENTQKITSDLDELTGDPAFRKNMKELVNGLSSLLSSTNQMQQQVKVATTLDSVQTAFDNSDFSIPEPTTKEKSIQQKKSLSSNTTIFPSASFKTVKPISNKLSSQERLRQQLRIYQQERNKNF